MADPILDYAITPHAVFEMERRGLDERVIARVMEAPGQRVGVRPGRVVLQSRIWMEAPAREYLVRVLVDIDRRPAEVVTAYRTTKLAKYWREA